jgi:hypothetical protein
VEGPPRDGATGTAGQKPKDSNPDKAEENHKREKIQILELHSNNPIISYRGRVFEGQWAKNIGTEILLAKRDEHRPLPSLQTLDGDVDMLAASWSRILTEERKMKPKVKDEEQEEDQYSKLREEHGISIPVGIDKSGEKAQQARFLENLMALKLKKGEADKVTVYAKGAITREPRGESDRGTRTRNRRVAVASSMARSSTTGNRAQHGRHVPAEYRGMAGHGSGNSEPLIIDPALSKITPQQLRGPEVVSPNDMDPDEEVSDSDDYEDTHEDTPMGDA